MQAKQFLRKHNYLLRMVLSLCLALYIPGFIFGLIVVRRSYDEMLKRNEVYYRETTASFAAYFNTQLNLLKNHALAVTIDNMKVHNKIIKETVESHPYYYLMATKALTDFKIGLPNTVDIGLYFKDTDYIITSTFKYTMNDFLRAYSGDSP